MDNSMKEEKVLRLDNPVVVRKVPMTNLGSDLLRSIRDYLVESYARQNGGKIVNIPFPVVIHMVLSDYAKMKGIKINQNERNR